MGRDLGFKKSYDTASIAFGSKPLAIIAAHDTSVEHSRGSLEQNSCVAYVSMYVKIGDMALLFYEQPSN